MNEMSATSQSCLRVSSQITVHARLYHGSFAEESILFVCGQTPAILSLEPFRSSKFLILAKG